MVLTSHSSYDLTSGMDDRSRRKIEEQVGSEHSVTNSARTDMWTGRTDISRRITSNESSSLWHRVLGRPSFNCHSEVLTRFDRHDRLSVPDKPTRIQEESDTAARWMHICRSTPLNTYRQQNSSSPSKPRHTVSLSLAQLAVWVPNL